MNDSDHRDWEFRQYVSTTAVGHGEITDDELSDATRRARARAIGAWPAAAT